MTVFPGVNVHTKEEFEARLDEIKNVGDGIHVDVMDGVYVPNTTVPVSLIGKLPGDRFCEAHLMVNSPVKYFEPCRKAGFKRVLVPFDALALDSYSQALAVQDQVHSLGMEFGLVFDHNTPIELQDDLCKFDKILVTTVVAGFSKQPFLPSQLEEIKKLNMFCRDMDIEADGHIDDTTVELVKEAGAKIVVSTSYLSGSEILSHYKKLKEV